MEPLKMLIETRDSKWPYVSVIMAAVFTIAFALTGSPFFPIIIFPIFLGLIGANFLYEKCGNGEELFENKLSAFGWCFWLGLIGVFILSLRKNRN